MYSMRDKPGNWTRKNILQNMMSEWWHSHLMLGMLHTPSLTERKEPDLITECYKSPFNPPRGSYDNNGDGC